MVIGVCHERTLGVRLRQPDCDHAQVGERIAIYGGTGRTRIDRALNFVAILERPVSRGCSQLKLLERVDLEAATKLDARQTELNRFRGAAIGCPCTFDATFQVLVVPIGISLTHRGVPKSPIIKLQRFPIPGRTSLAASTKNVLP